MGRTDALARLTIVAFVVGAGTLFSFSRPEWLSWASADPAGSQPGQFGNLVVIDSNHREIGPYSYQSIDYTVGGFQGLPDNVFVKIGTNWFRLGLDTNGQGFIGFDGNAANLYYQSPDCTGQPYMYAQSNVLPVVLDTDSRPFSQAPPSSLSGFARDSSGNLDIFYPTVLQACSGFPFGSMGVSGNCSSQAGQAYVMPFYGTATSIPVSTLNFKPLFRLLVKP